MNRLWVRLTLSHAVLLLTGILVVTFVTAQVLELTILRQAASQVAISSGLLRRLPELEAIVDSGNAASLLHGAGAPHVVIADGQGRVLYDWHGGEGRYLSALQRRLAVQFTVNGRVIAYVLPLPSRALGQEYAAIVAAQRRTVFVTGSIAAIAAVLVSLLVSESITSPLQRLVGAARAVAAGDLRRRIEPRGPKETRELAQAFNQMAEALAEAEQRRRSFTADIAHELRTPLSVLQANLSAMLDGVYMPTKEELAALYDESLRLNRLVQDLFQLAAFDAGQMQLEVEPVNLGRLLEGTVRVFQPAADAKGLAVSTDWPADLVVKGDRNRLGQVLTNLLTNSLRHTDPGGVIRVSARAVDGMAEVTVQDNGEGIAPDDLPHVFDRFWRAERSRSRDYGGAGLGLAIAKQLIEAMGGSIGAESQPGGGARFWFTLPLVSQAEAREPVAAGSANGHP